MPPKTMFWEAIPYDLWLLIALGIGAVARLCDQQVRTAKQSLQQLVYSVSVGSGFATLFIALTFFVEAVDIAATGFFVFFASLLVEVAQKKIHDLGETDISDWLLDVWKTTLTELAKYLPTKNATPK